MKFQLPFFALLVGVAAQNLVVDDIEQRVSPQVNKLANDVAGFPESGLEGALIGSLGVLFCQISNDT
jgi:hypothetical protein